MALFFLFLLIKAAPILTLNTWQVWVLINKLGKKKRKKKAAMNQVMKSCVLCSVLLFVLLNAAGDESVHINSIIYLTKVVWFNLENLKLFVGDCCFCVGTIDGTYTFPSHHKVKIRIRYSRRLIVPNETHPFEICERVRFVSDGPLYYVFSWHILIL